MSADQTPGTGIRLSQALPRQRALSPLSLRSNLAWTLAGNLVVDCVDTLTGVMLAQLVNPGTPVLFGCISSITDLRDMKYLAGAVEMGLMNAAATLVNPESEHVEYRSSAHAFQVGLTF